MECSSANLDHLADNGCNSGHIDLDPVQRLRNKCPPATFSRASPVVSSVQMLRLPALDDRTVAEIASHACHGDSDSAGRQELKRRLLNDKGAGHASCNMPFTASSRVSFEEVLAKVAAYPPLREMLVTTGTVTIERAIASHPAREGKQPEKRCELDPYCTNAPPSRATTDEFALLQDIQPLLSYPSLRDLLQTSANETGVRRKRSRVRGKKTRQQTENKD